MKELSMYLSYYEDIQLYKSIENFILSLGFKTKNAKSICSLKYDPHVYSFIDDNCEIIVSFADEALENEKVFEHVIYLQLFAINTERLLFEVTFDLKPCVLYVLKSELYNIKVKFNFSKLVFNG